MTTIPVKQSSTSAFCSLKFHHNWFRKSWDRTIGSRFKWFLGVWWLVSKLSCPVEARSLLVGRYWGWSKGVSLTFRMCDVRFLATMVTDNWFLGFIPDNILYLSYFYTNSELPTRLSYFWVSYQSTQIVSAFLAYGILRLRGYNGMAGWRWLFALEGLLTGIIGIISFFYLPPSPCQTASKFRGKDGWFNEREEKIMVNRILRDDPSKGTMHNRQGLSFKMFFDSLNDYHLWPIYLLGLSWLIPSNPMTSYLTLQLKAIGFNTFTTNLLTIPAYVLFIVQLLFWTWLSEKVNQRFLVGLVSQVWALPLLIALELIPADASHWAKWAVSALLVGHPYVHAIIVAITSRNAGTVRTRTVASAFYNMCVQAGQIISQNVGSLTSTHGKTWANVRSDLPWQWQTTLPDRQQGSDRDMRVQLCAVHRCQALLCLL